MDQDSLAFDDRTLIRLVSAGQSEYFVVLMARHMPAVRRRVQSILQTPSEVDDLIQDVVLKIWTRLSTFRGESCLRTWMLRVAMNEAFQSLRRARRRPSFEEFGCLDPPGPASKSPDECLARAEVARMIHNALTKLPATYRKVVILRDLQQFNERETATFLRSSIPAVRTRLHRARLMLGAVLKHPEFR